MKINDIVNRNIAEDTPAVGSGVFPTAKADIIAWQKANGLKPDGLIGDKTYAAMSAAGMKALPGFQKVPNKPKAPAAKPAEPAADSAAAPNNDSSSYTGTPATDAASLAAAQGKDLAPAGDQTAGGKTNADFLPGAAGGAQDIARLQQTAGVTPAANPLGVQAQTNVPGMQTGTAPAAPDTQAAQAAPAAAAPSALPNPWDGKDPAKAAAWSALSPEDQKWLGNADPTDKFILARSPSKGGFLGSVTPNFMKKKQPDAAQAAQAAPPAPGGTKGPATPGGYGRFNEDSDLTAMLRIAGLR
jgi:hypothetical protein